MATADKRSCVGPSARLLVATGILVSTGLGWGCGPEDTPRRGEDPITVRDTVGDTIVVRSTGSVWGEEATLQEDLRIGQVEGPPELTFGRIAGLAVAETGEVHVVDGQAPAVRVYDPEGAYLRTLGGEGEGPGEYTRPEGIAILSDGRPVVRDPGTGRLNVYSRRGEPLDAWPHRAGRFFTYPPIADTAGHLYNPITARPVDPPHEVTVAFVRFGPEGEAVDTLFPPRFDYDPPVVSGRTPAGNRRASDVPFAPDTHLALSPLGYLVGGVSTRYAVNVYRRDVPVIQIRREYDPVPVKSAESADHRRYIVDRISSMVPGWSWNGPDIPGVKAPYKDLFVGQKGRIWVQLHTPGKRLRTEPDQHPLRPEPPRWTEPVVFDVYEPDGRYLGRLRAPAGFQTRPQPVARGDTLWAAVQDDLGVEYVARFVVRPRMES